MTKSQSPENLPSGLPIAITPDLSAFQAVAEAIATLLHPHAEVVIHDIANDRIAGIWNAFSNRRVGDPSNLRNDPELQSNNIIVGPYEKAERDGGRIKSISAVLPDRQGNRAGYLCINLDMSKFDAAIELLSNFVSSPAPIPEFLFKGDLREQVNMILRQELLSMKKSMAVLTREDRRCIVRRLDEAHIFQARNSVPLVASALGLGRANLYHILRSVREKRE
ncbi:PAS domain-containing protein [Novosphingobium sp. 11B]